MWLEGNPTGAATQTILYWRVRYIISIIYLVSCGLDITLLASSSLPPVAIGNLAMGHK
jgi:hypothetical protein